MYIQTEWGERVTQSNPISSTSNNQNQIEAYWGIEQEKANRQLDTYCGRKKQASCGLGECERLRPESESRQTQFWSGGETSRARGVEDRGEKAAPRGEGLGAGLG